MRTRAPLAAAVLAALTAALYAKTASFDFVFDDLPALVNNPRVAGGLTAAAARWALTATDLANWHPLTWLSHLADVSLFGMRPGPMHLENALLHALAAAALFALLRAATGALWPSAAAAALFAAHPLRVESVAWITERKDLLCALFSLLALLAWTRHVRRPAPRRYAGAAFLFAAALASKPMAVTLPGVMLLLDWWPYGRLGTPARGTRLREALLEKAPLFLLSLAAAAVTLAAQSRGGTVRAWADIPAGARAANAAWSLLAYLRSMLWPAGLAAYYPHPGASLPAWRAAAAAACVAALLAAALRARRTEPWLATGALWYLGTLLPVIGLVQVGDQARADRYTYLPSVGVAVAAVWGLAALALRHPRARPALAAAGAGVPLLLAAASSRQLEHWRSQRAVFTRALAAAGPSALAHFNLGNVEADEGRRAEAIAHYREALRLDPGFLDARINLAVQLQAAGELDEAGAHYAEALRRRPGSAEAHLDYGTLLERLGLRAAALAEYRRAVELGPGRAVARMNLGNALSDAGDYAGALAQYAEAGRLAPGDAAVHANRGVTYAQMGNAAAAAAEYREALRLDPANAIARRGLGAVPGAGRVR